VTDSTFATRRRRLLRAVATPTGVVTVLIAVTFMFLVIAGPTLWGGPAAKDNVDQIFLGASWRHPFGTDNIGRDLFARTLVATRLSLKLALEATALGATLGITLGTLTGLMGRRANRALATFINLALAFPGLLIAIFLAIIFGAGARGAVLALAGAYAPYFARLAQTLTAAVTGKEYLAAARILGVRTHRILLRHVLPNIAEPIIVTVTVAAGGTLLAFAGLSFLGLGVQIPDYDWGLLLNQGLDRIDTAPMATVGPGVAIVIAGIGFQLLGDLISRAVSAPATVRRTSGPTPTTAPTSLPEDADGAVVIAERLTVSFGGSPGGTTPVRGVSLVVPPGQMLGIVGESGSGKTLLAMALAGLLPAGASVSAERLEFLGNDLLRRPTAATQRVLGTRLGLVFQNPAAALNPSMKVARQLTEGAMFHSAMSRRAATERAVSTLRAVAIPAPERRMRQYPHELSGGMKQRAVIAMSLMGSPALIIADEPTTALDVTVQGQILDLLRGINVDTGAAAVLISHDIAVVASVCDRVVVMYGGTVVEDAPVDVALRRPAHPYTHALLRAVPGMDTARDQPLTTIAGRPPDPVEFPPGCPFSPRCPWADDDCRRELPVLTELSVGHRVACRHPLTAGPTDVHLHTVGTP
jgi:peptide/nickel transport system permease protein